ncbi:vigilin-like [Mytilus californianus]|uniref:vigilin-like n=1 Tax=Mytilus californianus TaxID=6549 RepID=UPI00224620E0|nr:vigilin-like [Mytilus californianus]
MATNMEVPHIEEVAYVPNAPTSPPTYSDAFPELPMPAPRPVADLPVTEPTRPWPANNKFLMRSSTCTQVFTVPVEERRFNDHSFGDETKQAETCKEIMARNNVSIEMSLAKDQSLTVVIHGKDKNVMQARREIVARLQTQAQLGLKIPREHHRYILGKSGKKLQELELSTSTKISIPKPDEGSDLIRITGTKEGIERARHEIQCTSDEQAKLAFERLPVPKIYHPFICGPKNENVDRLIKETGAKINVPPPSVMKDEIVISGDKDGVAKCKDEIMRIYMDKKRKCQTVSVEVRKTQHKYIIGPRYSGIHEILKETGVAVEVPSLDDNIETITLRGEQDKLGPALTMVYSKANSNVMSEVGAPSWLHRYIIGRKGQNIQKITEQFSKVHIEFTEGTDKINVEGPPEEVNEAVKELEVIVKDLKKRMSFAEISVDQRFHKHIIGKNGQNVTRIKNETGVAIKIPADEMNSPIIRIEGDPKGVEKAKEELLLMARRMENEKTRDIIIEQRFHRTLIGARGDNIKEIKDKFNQVQITFPDPGKKSDIVQLRGPKDDVDKCYKYLISMHTDMIASNYKAEVHIFKDFHKNIIGKGGSNIRKIRDETDTKIDLPSENAESDVIVITGKKPNVEKARKLIEDIQKDLANIKEEKIEIPHNLHNSIIGAKGRLIRSIAQECGGVIIRFPQQGSTANTVTIRGPKNDVENAKKQLQELTNEKQQSGFTAEVRAKPEYHRFLIGRNGSNIRQVRERTGARVIFPSQDDDNQELITIIGKKESVDQAKAELEERIKSLDDVVSIECQVPTKHHRHFVARRGEVLKHIADEYGGVTVSFPRSGIKSETVVIKGSKDCVEGAKRRILEIVADLDAQVTVECVIPQQYHRTVMGNRGMNVQEITRVHEVGIKFPDRAPQQNGGGQNDGGQNGAVPAENSLPNGDVNGDEAGHNKSDIIVITGKPENCEAAKLALQDLVPVTEEMTVPFDYHRYIIGAKGKDVREMMGDYDVNISIPPAEDHSDKVKVTGPPANVKRALEALQERCDQLEKEKEDRLLKSFQVKCEVDPQYHSKIIGRRGAVVNKLRDQFDVNIQFPGKEDPDTNIITITGYEDKANAAKAEILKMVRDYEEMTSIECKLDHRVHPRIIGAKGKNIRKLMDDFKVDIRFPRGPDENPDIIYISGGEDDCYDCRDHLLNIEEEFLQDFIDQEYLKQLTKPQRDQGPRKERPGAGFTVTDAPWNQSQVPDTMSNDDFPTFGAVVQPKSSHAWGPKPGGKR